MSKIIKSWINGTEHESSSNQFLNKYNPANGDILSIINEPTLEDIDFAIQQAKRAYSTWSELTSIQRGDYLFELVALMKENAQELANIVALETGKSLKDANGEVNAAIRQGQYFASEGMRMYSNVLPSAINGKYTHTVRKPIGVAGLIVPANTPIANIAWKIFPALICGNTIVLKASEDAPEIALKIAQLSKKAGFPDGIINIIQGRGDIAGKSIVEHPLVSVISFTGSTNVGKWIASAAGKRLARVSLELGGKNPFIVCDDANIDQAIEWALLSAFSNAGQRCAAGSRILIFENIYDFFVEKLVKRTEQLRVGNSDQCDLGPVISEKQLNNILDLINHATNDGGITLTGGYRLNNDNTKNGYYIAPTLISELPREHHIVDTEIFGPVATLHKVKDLEDALTFSNNSQYGLTGSIHTKDIDKAIWFAQRIKAGTINVNLGTFGSEPHFPFGGFGLSGNGTREPGVEALNVYSELKTISFYVREKLI